MRSLLKFVQMLIVIALLLSTVGPAMASPATIPAQAKHDAIGQARPNRLVQLPAAQTRTQTLPLGALSASSLDAVGWTTIFTDSFESFPGDWQLYTGALDQAWGATMVDADIDYNPDSFNSVWPAAGGVDAVDPADDEYPPDMESWMIQGPFDLTDYKAADLDFSTLFDIEEGDWLGVCASSFTSAPAPEDFDQDLDCNWMYGTTEGWEHDYLDLIDYVGLPNLYIAFVFQSDSSNVEPYFGAYVDEVELWVNDMEVDLTDPQNEFVDWAEVTSQSFDMLDTANDPLWKVETLPAGSAWVTTTVDNDDATNPLSSASISPTPNDAYTAGEESWLFYGPVDLSDQVAADVFYSVLIDLIYSDDDDASNDDWMAFCAVASDKALADLSGDDVDYANCDWWTGYSGGVWDEGFFDLTPFAGRSQVYLAWYFETNNANNAGGVFVDELFVEAQHASAAVPPEVNFNQAGISLINGDFSDGLTGWTKQAPNGETGDVTVVEGAAAITGNQLLLQSHSVPSDTVSLSIYFDFAVATTETTADADTFCVSLTQDGDPGALLADVGCWDASHLPEFARDGLTYDNFGYSVPQALSKTLRGQTVSLLFELTQNESLTSTLLVDNVVIYAVGQANRNPTTGGAQAASLQAVSAVAAPRDANEPNDYYENATALACNQTKAGVFGDVVGTVNKDVDVFRMDRVPVGKLVITIDAAKLNPASSADSVLFLVDTSFNDLAISDDYGSSLDSLLVYTNTVPNATFYVVARNYNTDGVDAFYSIKSQCGQTEAPVANPPAVTPPASTSDTRKPWTMILFLNGEDQACVTSQSPTSCWDKATYEKVVEAIEGFIGAKQDVMNVVVLIDGPNYGGVASDVTRYVVQPNGVYTNGVNKWTLDEINMGDPKTLVDFANWAIANYPADHYYLSIDDHGGGISGTSWDHHDVGGKKIDDQITPAEMRSAIQQITRNGERKIDILAFESCLMGLFENLYDLKDYTTYITAFQSISWTALQYPAYFKDLEATDTVEEFGRHIIQAYPVSSTQTPYTFSLFKSSLLEAVKVQLDGFATALMGANLPTLTSIRNVTQAFAGSPSKGDAATDAFGELDLWDFAQRVKTAGIAANQATSLQAAIDAAVIEKKAVLKGRTPIWDYTNYHGMSITYPNGAYNAMETYCQTYKLSDNGNGAWTKFLTMKVFGEYTWDCGGATAGLQSATVQQDGLRLLRLPVFLEPRPLAMEDEATPSIFLPFVGKPAESL